MKPVITNFIDATLEERIDLVCYQGTYVGVREYCGYMAKRIEDLKHMKSRVFIEKLFNKNIGGSSDD